MYKPLSNFRSSKSAFTLIEIMVVVSIVGIVASLVSINYSQSRRIARDTKRKQDVSTYKSALDAYRITNGNYFVVDAKKGGCTLGGSDNQDHLLGTGAGCTGASGLSYGKLNLGNNQQADGQSNGHPTRTYVASSIAAALQDDGYISTAVKDPQAPDSLNPSSPDYVLIRCCPDGKQNINTAGTVYAIWAVLEGQPTGTDSSNSLNYCGGSGAAAYSNYRFDFATKDADLPASLLYSNGNAFPKTQASAAGICPAG